MQLDALPLILHMARTGQDFYSDTMRELLRQVSPQLLRRLKQEDSADLKEPFLFSYFTSPNGITECSLEQLFAAKLWSTDPGELIAIVTNGRGASLIPGLGYVRSNTPGSRIETTLPTGLWTSSGHLREKPDVELDYVPLLYVDESIEVLREYVPLLNQFFGEHAGDVEQTVAVAAEDHSLTLSNALQILKSSWSDLHGALSSVLRRVVLFQCQHFNSFATPAAHGTAFINLNLGNTEAFFLEDLAHQGGHVLLAAATVDQSAFFNGPSDQELSSLTGNSDDDRTIYIALHGLVTEAFMTVLLTRCLQQKSLPPTQTFELLGRCAFIFRRFTSDLSLIGELPIFNNFGGQLIHSIKESWNQADKLHGTVFRQLDFSNQEYNFSYSLFLEANLARMNAEFSL